jgi:pimeloyl-ACP methyl ester carboxylesterase
MRENLTIDGVNIYYKGNIKRGAVIFLHGSSLSALAFREQFRQISAFPMLALDLPGHGRSVRADDPAEVYNIPAYARLLVRIVHELELEDVVLAGHALGANIAIEAAEQIPGLRGLFLFSMNPFSVPAQLDSMCRPGPFLGYLVGGRMRPTEALLLAEELLQGNEALADLLASWILETDTAARMSFAASLGLDKFGDELGMLRKFAKPLAILQGKNDRIINPRYMDGLNPVSLWKNGIIELDAGHVPQMEVPERFNALVEDFYRYALGTGAHAKSRPGRLKPGIIN